MKSIRNVGTVLLAGCVAWGLAAAQVGPKGLSPDELRVDYREQALGVDTSIPRLSWKWSDGSTIGTQQAYQVQVASSPAQLQAGNPDLWDSGRVNASRNHAIRYEGSPLQSRQRAYWRVRIWDESGEPSAWSAIDSWEMALLNPDDWQAEWIRHPAFTGEDLSPKPAPYFRKTFEIETLPVSARAYVTGLGYFELYLNGEKVGDHVLDPVKTRYDRSVNYLVHDITPLLRPGKNVVGMVLGTGWYNHFAKAAWGFDEAPWRDHPEALCQLEIVDSEGQRQVVVSGADWKTTTQGPVRFDGIRNGEVHDARLEMPGWSTPAFDDRNWEPVILSDGPAGVLRAQSLPPIRELQEIRPVSVQEVKPGVWVFDLGQNIAGYSRLKVAGPRGTEVRMKMGERLHPDGTVEQKQILRFLKTGEAQTDTYILKGEGEEVWNPRFVYHGYQYIEVHGLPVEPTLETITGVVLATDFAQHGSFASSDPVLNRTQQNMVWSFYGNYHGLPTDCPHREKIGWTGDAQLVSETGLFFFDTASSYLKWMDDFVDEQRENGDLPGVIPTSGWGYTHGRPDRVPAEIRELGYGPQWDGAIIQIVWDLYRFTGDAAILERYYGTIQRYLEHLIRNAPDGTLNFGIDDHKPVVTRTEGDYLSSGYLVGYTAIFSRMAAILGRDADATRYAEQSERARKAFNAKYFDTATARYGNGGQTAQALALYFDIPEPAERARVLARLLEAVEEHDEHFDAGVVGLKFLFNVLREAGESELLYRMVTQRDFPGFAYWLEQGANTLWQDWDGSMSLNHIMFATVNEWFFEAIAGIQIDAEQPGFAHFHVKPDFLSQLQWATASHDSVRGMVASSWHRDAEGMVTLRVTVPPNSTATVHVPDGEGKHTAHTAGPGTHTWQVKGL